MNVHLIDGTYELFRHYYGVPRARNAEGMEVAATRAVVASVLRMLADGATHVAVATDHVVESFRNDLWPTYKDGSRIEPELRAQFDLLENALRAAGVTVWAMVEHEADDALASGAELAAADPRVETVFLCTPDKDLAQCVVGERVVQFDRRARRIIDEAGVIEKFGVPPASIPDYLALVGDSADGFPGIPGWGVKSAGAVLSRYGRLEEIPRSEADWEVTVRGAGRLAATLAEQLPLALLFRELATLARDAPIDRSVDALRWTGPTGAFAATCAALDASELADRAAALGARRP